ncbi:Sensory neuron membrane protein 2 [Halotydeus destructor]|nr:Sensory neuron membrane protein 2 [Halotydeus destructor]
MVLVDQVINNKERTFVNGFFRAVITTQKEEPFPTRSARDLIYGHRDKMIVKIQQAAKALKFPFPVMSDTIGILSRKRLLPYSQDWGRILQDSSLPLCLLNGSLDTSSCKHATIVTSFRFNEVTPCLHQNGAVIHPDPEKLDTSADAEPQTGLSLRGAKRLQVNARLFRDVRIPSVSHLPNLLIPFTRFEEGVELNEAPNEQFNSHQVSLCRHDCNRISGLNSRSCSLAHISK